MSKKLTAKRAIKIVASFLPNIASAAITEGLYVTTGYRIVINLPELFAANGLECTPEAREAFATLLPGDIARTAREASFIAQFPTPPDDGVTVGDIVGAMLQQIPGDMLADTCDCGNTACSGCELGGSHDAY